MFGPVEQEAGGGLWSSGTIATLGGFFVAPLGAEGAGGLHEHRHAAFGQEHLLMCWDAKRGRLMLVADHSKTEYWGERVLRVKERAPYDLDLTFDCRQSDLWELGGPWQGWAALQELRGLDCDAKQELCSHLAGCWESRRESQQIQASLVDPEPSAPRGRHAL